MTFYADFTKQGYNLLRHHDRSFDVKYRLVSFACRVGGPDRGLGQGYDEFGVLQGVRTNWTDGEAQGKDTHGDIVNWSMWQVDDTQGTIHDGASSKQSAPSGSKQRTIPGWAQAWAALATEGASPADDSGGATTSGSASGTITVQPVFSQKWDADGRFKGKSLPLPPGFDNVPNGTPVIVLCGTDEYSQQDLAIPVLPNALDAPHEAGDPNLGTYVYDLTSDDELDKQRRAHLQTLTRVWEIPKSGVVQSIWGPDGKHALAIQMGQARGGVNGRAVFADFGFPQQILGAPSIVAHGPFHVGSNSDKHFFGKNSDGDTLNSLHIWTDAYFKRDDFFDGPIEFNGIWVPPGSAGQPWKTFINFDPNEPHSHPTGDKPGRWKLETWVPLVYATDPHKDGGFGTDPFDGDQTFTNPEKDGTFKTNPSKDETFTDPSADQTFTTPGDDTFGTNSPANPDADQTFSTPSAETTFPPGGNPPTDGPSGEPPVPPITDGPVGGGSRPKPKPKTPVIRPPFNPANPGGTGSGGGFNPPTDGPSDGGFIKDGPFIIGRGGVGSNTLPPDTFGGDDSGLIPVDGQTLQPLQPPQIDIIGSGDINPVDIGLDITPPEILQNVTTLSTGNIFSAPGFVFKPQNVNDNDMRYSTGWGGAGDINDLYYSPAVAQIEATGGMAADGTWDYATGAGADRFGYSAQGAVNFMPPNVGTEQIFYSTPPTDFPTTSFNFYQSRLTFGTPLTDGLVGDGFAVYLSGGNLVVDTLGSDGKSTSTAQLWPDVDSGGGGGALTTGTLAGLPGAPTAVGDTYIITDKVNTPGGGSGSADPTDFFNVGINDALMWGKLALLNFDQKITGIWTANGTGVVTFGTGTVNCNQIQGKGTPSSPGTGQALIYNGTSYATTTLGIAGGGTNNSSSFTNPSAIYYDGTKYNGVAPATGGDQGGQVLAYDGTNIGWQFGLNHGAKSGANVSGVSMFIDGQQSTGSALGGSLVFRTTRAGTAGSGVNSLVTTMLLDGAGNITMSGSVATNATDGFIYLNSCGGTPTGTPTTYTNQVPFVVDRTNKVLYGYMGGAWTQVGGSGGTPTLAQVLVSGDTTGGTNIVLTGASEITNNATGVAVTLVGIDNVNSTGASLAVNAAATADTSGGAIFLTPGSCNSNGGSSISLYGGTSSKGGKVDISGGQTSGVTDTSGDTFTLTSCGGSGTGVDGGIAMRVCPISLTGSSTSPNFATTVWTLKGVQNHTSGTQSLLTINPTWQDGGQTTSTVGRTLYINPTVNYTGTNTGAYEAVVINVVETSAPAGTNYLIRWQVGGTDKASVDSSGNLLAKRKVTASTSTVTLANTDSRKLSTNTGAGSQVTHNLPAAAVGLEFPFYVDASAGIKVVPNGSDTIRIQGAVSTAGSGYASSTVQGSSLTLVCIASATWVATSALGTWTVV